MVEAVPAQIAVKGHESGVGMNTSFSGKTEGVGVFRFGSEHPTPLEDLWLELEEAELQRVHLARIQPVDDAHASSLYWALGSLVAMGAGLGTAAAIQDDSPTGAGVAGVSGLTLGLVGVIGALLAQPSGYDQMAADARREMFIPGEDDIDAVVRGVSRLNTGRQKRCASGN